MGQTPITPITPKTPNLSNPTTVEDYNALKALRSAQADALDAEAKMIASQMALHKAQADDTAAAQLAAATQAANIAAQQKALSDSQAAMLKTKFTVPDSGYSGEVKTGDKAGTFEASLLAAHALKAAARTIAGKVAAVGIDVTNSQQAWDTVVLYSGADLPDFQPLITFRAQYQALSQALDETMKRIDDAQAKVAPLLPPRPEFVTPEMIGMGLDAVNKILGYFRTDYSVQGISVASDDLLLLESLAGELTLKNKKVYLPALYNATALQDSTIITNLNDLAIKRARLQQKIDTSLTVVENLTAAAAKEADVGKKKQFVDAATNLKTAADQGKTAVTMYDALLTKLTSPDDKGKIPLAVIIQQDAVRTKLQGEKVVLMTAKISSAGGTYYTRKNIWSLFAGMPFYVMGGAIVDYGVFDGKDGKVVIAGSLPVDSGFFNVKKVENEFRVAAEKTTAQQ